MNKRLDQAFALYFNHYHLATDLKKMLKIFLLFGLTLSVLALKCVDEKAVKADIMVSLLIDD